MEKQQLDSEKREIVTKIEEHRKGSDLGAMFHVICAIAGTGILGLPKAVSESGWLSISLIIVGAFVAFYSGHLLIQCLYYKPGKRLKTYPEVGFEAFGSIGKYIVIVAHYSIILGSVCVYILITGSNCSQIAEMYKFDIGKSIWTLIAGCIVATAYCLLKSLKEVMLLSVFGVLATVSVVIIGSILGLINFATTPTVIEYNIIVPDQLAYTLSIVSFSFAGSVVFPHVEHSMQNPKNWNKVLLKAIILITLMYLTFSIIGYLSFGNIVKSIITESLGSSIPAQITLLSMTLHILLASPVYLCSFGVVIEDQLGITKEKIGKIREFIFRILTRLLTVTILTSIAIYFDYIQALMGLIGSLSNGIIVFIIPAICHIKLFGLKNRTLLEKFVLILIIVIGVLCFILGGQKSLSKLIKSNRVENKDLK